MSQTPEPTAIHQPNVTQMSVRDVFDEDPMDAKLAIPLVLGPELTLLAVVQGRGHASHATELAAGIDTEEQVQGSQPARRPVRRVQPSVPTVRARPDVVLQAGKCQENHNKK